MVMTIPWTKPLAEGGQVQVMIAHPKGHDHGKEDAGSESFEHYLCYWFENGVGDEEDSKR